MDNRHDGLDTVRALACIMVVAIHTAAPLVVAGPDAQGWAAANALDGAARWAVPVFFMLTGWAYLGDRAPRTKAFAKMFAALLFYTVLALLARMVQTPGLPSLDFLWREPAFYHLWYFYVALAVYGTLALVRLRADTPRGIVWAVLAAPLVFNPQLPFLVGGGETGNLMQLGKGYGLYVVYAFVDGGLALAWPNEGRWRGPLAVCTAMIGVGWTIAATHGSSIEAGAFVNTHYGYGSLGPMLAAYGVFLWGLTTPRMPESFTSFVRIIAKRSLAVYGLHPFVLVAIGMIHPLRDLDAGGLVLAWLVTLGASLMAAGILIRIDRGRWVS